MIFDTFLIVEPKIADPVITNQRQAYAIIYLVSFVIHLS